MDVLIVCEDESKLSEITSKHPMKTYVVCKDKLAWLTKIRELHSNQIASACLYLKNHEDLPPETIVALCRVMVSMGKMNITLEEEGTDDEIDLLCENLVSNGFVVDKISNQEILGL
jgi:hypothetical protein